MSKMVKLLLLLYLIADATFIFPFILWQTPVLQWLVRPS